MLSIITLIFLISHSTHGFNIRDISQSITVTNHRKGSEFGYSIALHKNEDGKWLLVGAPKYFDGVKSSNFHGPRDGALYKCPLKELGGTGREENDCRLIDATSSKTRGATQPLLLNNFERHGFVQMKDDDFDWERHVGPTDSDKTGPSFDHTIQNGSNGWYMLLEASHPRTVGETTRITTPVLPLVSAGCIRFWYHMRGTSVGSLNIYTFTNSTGSRMVWSLEHDQGDVWHEGWVTVTPQEKYQVIFEGVVGQDYNSDIGFDDVSILNAACAEDKQSGSGSLGTTVTTEDKTGRVLVCAPTWVHSCKGQNHVTGLCYLFDKNISSGTSEILAPCRSSSCNDGQMDLIFLIDGSDSVNVLDFKKMIRWLNNVISSLSIGKDMTRVGVAQYSIKPRTEFHLNEHFKLEGLRKAVKGINYMRGTTATGRAIDFISKEMFTEERGMRPNAKHVAVVITDGKSQDDVVSPSERVKARGITLFAIGVGVAVESELRNISSDPDEQFVYSVNSYKALDGIRGQFQKKLYSLESQGSTFTTEQCQSGTSADFVDRKPIIGLPGLQDWSGGFAIYSEVEISHPIQSNLKELLGSQKDLSNHNNTENRKSKRPEPTSHTLTLQARIRDVSYQTIAAHTHERRKNSAKSANADDLIKNMVAHSYFGYSISSGSYSHPSSVDMAIGAPRLKSKGGVFMINVNEYNGTNLTLVDSFVGEQMGSYFGHAVCMTDMNNDGLDEVIIGAPLFMGRFEDIGLVDIYISDKETGKASREKVTLTGLSERNARFGFSISEAGDLNGDGYGDLVIGAPSHANGDGAVYIYNGRKDLKLLEAPSQILRSSDLNMRPDYLGFSLHAGIDVDGNGYPDIASGAPGNSYAFVMLSRPVIHVNGRLKSFPSVVNISQPSCYMPHRSFSSIIPNICTTVEICFEATGKNIPKIILLKFTLTADVNREADLVRAHFYEYKNEIEVLSGGNDTTCTSATLVFEEPVYDVSTDVSIQMEYGLSHKISDTNDSAMLNMYDKNPVYSTVRLAKNCRNRNCEADLNISCSILGVQDLNETLSLTVGDDRILNLAIDLTNLADDAYHVMINVEYHNGLYLHHLQQTTNYVSIVKDRSVSTSGVNKSKNHGEKQLEENKALKDLLLKYNNPILSREKSCRFNLQFGIANQSSFYGNPLIISVKVESSVSDLNIENNFCESNVPLHFEAKVLLVGDIENPQVPFSLTTTTPRLLSDIGPNISLSYYVQNYGYATIPSSSIEISWPSTMSTGKNILYLTGIECFPSSKCVCNNTEHLLNLYRLDSTNDESSGHEMDPSTDDLNNTNFLPDYEGEQYDEIWMSCDKGNFNCESLNCFLTGINPSDMVKVTIDFRISEQTLTEIKAWRAHLITSAEYKAHSSTPFVILNSPPLKQKVTVTAFNTTVNPNKESIVPASLSKWVIVIAVVVGILTLALVMLLLYKRGFFESKYRQKKEEILEWRDYQQYSSAHEGRVHQPTDGNEDTAQHKMTTFQRRGN